MFDIPVVLLTFKREKVICILDVLKKVKPKKIYILSDNGRNDEEKKEVHRVRKIIESNITWDCEVIKNYAKENRGVYGNIALGSKWVFEREKKAIFLEDDNLPEESFFYFCEEMLNKYEKNEKILWICGTNYLGDFSENCSFSYVFTQHLLPCGWASWSNKFLKYYDEKMEYYNNKSNVNLAKKRYINDQLARQYVYYWNEEHKRIINGIRPVSWDYQMDFALKFNDLYGICPCKNQIKNIGVDAYSIHGGSDKTSIMNQRFCGMDSYPLDFPLSHPKKIEINDEFEKAIGKIMLYPIKLRMKNIISHCIRNLFNIPGTMSVKEYFGLNRKKNENI